MMRVDARSEGRRKREKNVPRLSSTLYPKMIERQFERDIGKLSKAFEDLVDRFVLKALPKLEPTYQRQMGLRLDAEDDEYVTQLNEMMKGVLSNFSNHLQSFKKTLRKTGYKANTHNREQFMKASQEYLGVNLFDNDPGLEEAVNMWVRENVKDISNLALNETRRLEKIITDGFRNGIRPEEIANGITDAFKKSEYRKTIQAKGHSLEDKARFIARDQLGKLNSQITRTRQNRLGIKRYRWRTSLDERVRGNPGGKYPNVPKDQNHHAREGKIFYWNASDGPIPPDGHPGVPYNCRCEAEPVFDDMFTED